MNSRLVWMLVLFGTLLFFGCNRTETAIQPVVRKTPPPNAYFQTHWQDESQFIVEAILTDIAEMAYYANNHALPDSNIFSVEAKENRRKFRAPVYDVEISLSKTIPTIKFQLPVTNAIWSPAVYSNATVQIFGALGLHNAGGYRDEDDGSVLRALTDAKAVTLEEQNKAISARLDKDFSNATTHEQAALIASVFANRDTSGAFYDIRLPLTRVTSHLAMATALAGGSARTVSGTIAEAFLNQCMANQQSALQKIHELHDYDKTTAVWVRTVEAASSGDYRALEKISNPTMLERITWFGAYAGSVNVATAWPKLTEDDLQFPDFCRTANAFGHSVEVGHVLVRYSLPLEFKEIYDVYGVSRGGKMDKHNFISELNQLPERCFTAAKNGQPTVRVIGWGQWAMFFQRHLCHASHCNYEFLRDKYGDLEEAHKFSSKMLATCKGLRMFPFLARFICDDEQTYRKAVDDGFALTVVMPHLVSPQVWNNLCWPCID